MSTLSQGVEGSQPPNVASGNETNDTTKTKTALKRGIPPGRSKRTRIVDIQSVSRRSLRIPAGEKAPVESEVAGAQADVSERLSSANSNQSSQAEEKAVVEANDLRNADLDSNEKSPNAVIDWLKYKWWDMGRYTWFPDVFDPTKKYTPDKPFRLAIPQSYLGLYKHLEFVPENIIPPSRWNPIRKSMSRIGVSEYNLRQLFIEFCDPNDIAGGTVKINYITRRFEAHDRRLFRILISTLSKEHGSGVHRSDRVPFEEAVFALLEFCSFDVYSLMVQFVVSVTKVTTMNVGLVRALIRYLWNDKFDDFVMAILRRIACPEGKPNHSLAAFVHLGMRYPVLVYPLIGLQRSVQRKILGLNFWKKNHAQRHSQLVPFGFMYADFKMLTARVIMLETVSSAAIPFQFGSKRTATYAHSKKSPVYRRTSVGLGQERKSYTSSHDLSMSQSGFMKLEKPEDIKWQKRRYGKIIKKGNPKTGSLEQLSEEEIQAEIEAQTVFKRKWNALVDQLAEITEPVRVWMQQELMMQSRTDTEKELIARRHKREQRRYARNKLNKRKMPKKRLESPSRSARRLMDSSDKSLVIGSNPEKKKYPEGVNLTPHVESSDEDKDTDGEGSVEYTGKKYRSKRNLNPRESAKSVLKLALEQSHPRESSPKRDNFGTPYTAETGSRSYGLRLESSRQLTADNESGKTKESNRTNTGSDDRKTGTPSSALDQRIGLNSVSDQFMQSSDMVPMGSLLQLPGFDEGPEELNEQKKRSSRRVTYEDMVPQSADTASKEDSKTDQVKPVMSLMLAKGHLRRVRELSVPEKIRLGYLDPYKALEIPAVEEENEEETETLQARNKRLADSKHQEAQLQLRELGINAKDAEELFNEDGELLLEKLNANQLEDLLQNAAIMNASSEYERAKIRSMLHERRKELKGDKYMQIRLSDQSVKATASLAFAFYAQMVVRKAREARQGKVAFSRPLEVLLPVQTNYQKNNPPPFGAELEANSLQIARVTLLHAASGIGLYPGVVRSRCLFTGTLIAANEKPNVVLNDESTIIEIGDKKKEDLATLQWFESTERRAVYEGRLEEEQDRYCRIMWVTKLGLEPIFCPLNQCLPGGMCSPNVRNSIKACCTAPFRRKKQEEKIAEPDNNTLNQQSIARTNDFSVMHDSVESSGTWGTGCQDSIVRLHPAKRHLAKESMEESTGEVTIPLKASSSSRMKSQLVGETTTERTDNTLTDEESGKEKSESKNLQVSENSENEKLPEGKLSSNTGGTVAVSQKTTKTGQGSNTKSDLSLHHPMIFPDSKPKSDSLQQESRKCHNTGFCEEADEYIHRCLADAFGYKFANLIVEAARAPPERADVVKREHMKAIRTGQSLRNPKRYIGSSNGYLFDEDVWIELWDDLEQEFFYYNLATATSVWSKPKVYRAYEVSAMDFY